MTHYWGKILGFIFGYMFARFPGAILGLVIGHFFDRGYSRAFDRIGGFASLMSSAGSVKSRAVFFHTLFSIMGHIAKSSGRVTEADIALASTLMDRLKLNKAQQLEAQAAYKEGKQDDFPIKETVIEFRQFCAGRSEFTQMYLELQIQAALINGQLNSKAKDVLFIVAKTLRFSPTELEALIQQIQAGNRFHQQQQEKRNARRNSWKKYTGQSNSSTNHDELTSAYAVLGVKEDSSEKDVKKAYKRLMSQHHPDKLSAQGLPEQAMLLAKERAQDIQSAWDLIKKEKF